MIKLYINVLKKKKAYIIDFRLAVFDFSVWINTSYDPQEFYDS